VKWASYPEQDISWTTDLSTTFRKSARTVSALERSETDLLRLLRSRKGQQDPAVMPPAEAFSATVRAGLLQCILEHVTREDTTVSGVQAQSDHEISLLTS
jgi:hypothetical protein